MTKKKNNEKLNVKKTASFEVSADRKKMVSDLIHDPMYVPMKEKEIAILVICDSCTFVCAVRIWHRWV